MVVQRSPSLRTFSIIYTLFFYRAEKGSLGLPWTTGQFFDAPKLGLKSLRSSRRVIDQLRVFVGFIIFDESNVHFGCGFRSDEPLFDEALFVVGAVVLRKSDPAVAVRLLTLRSAPHTLDVRECGVEISTEGAFVGFILSSAFRTPRLIEAAQLVARRFVLGPDRAALFLDEGAQRARECADLVEKSRG